MRLFSSPVFFIFTVYVCDYFLWFIGIYNTDQNPFYNYWNNKRTKISVVILIQKGYILLGNIFYFLWLNNVAQGGINK